MKAFMFLQTTLGIVCLITHIPNVRALTNMYVLMFSQMALITECHITLHSSKGNHHYVCGDVFSACPFHGIHNYILNKYMGAHHYVCVDVLLNGPDA